MKESEGDGLGFTPWAMFWFALLLIVFFGFVWASQQRNGVGAIGLCGLIFLSSAAVGSLLGFIFAVPRVIAKEGAEVAQSGEAKLLSTNTNLERISDWLTTMLVGVGLSQLTNLNGVLLQFRGFLAESATVYIVNGVPSAGVLPAVGPFILILGAASGFLFMYLLTRLGLVGFFRDSEEMLGGVALAALQVAVSQAQSDQQAPPSEEEASSAVSGAVAPEVQAATATFARASRADTLSTDDVLEVMFKLLYQPAGYRRVIQMSGEVSRSPVSKRADYWFYLSAAFGQQMHHTAAGSEERLSARDNALDAAQRAVRIDKSFRSRLWEISNPEATDNDLALLRDDPDFRKLVGRS